VAARRVGGGAAAVAGVAALGHDADAVLVAVREDARYRGGVRRRDDGERMAAIQGAMITQHRCGARRVGDQRIAAGDSDESTQQCRVVVHVARIITRQYRSPSEGQPSRQSVAAVADDRRYREKVRWL
jgi:hypothetical protein